MKKLIIICIISFIIVSCNHKDKFEFIRNYLNNPEKLIELLENADFDASVEIKYLKKGGEYFQRYINWAKYFTIFNGNETEVFFDIEEYYSDSEWVIIIIKSKNEYRLKFTWYKENNGIWRLNYIRPDNGPDKYEDP